MNDRFFKGIALFTPGGDLIYCLDSRKSERWHLHLCTGLQQVFGLQELPHFLIPGWTATVDRWFDVEQSRERLCAELHPPVERHRLLLSRIFGVEEGSWQILSWQEQIHDPLLLETYRDRFPQLWQHHNLIVCLDNPKLGIHRDPGNSSYVLRLFVSGSTAATARTLATLHEVLESQLPVPYTLKVIDVLERPELAERDRIAITPTLVRVLPQPERRIVGELEDLDRILQRVMGS